MPENLPFARLASFPSFAPSTIPDIVEPEPVPTWQPTPPPPEADAVLRKRQEAAELTQKALQAQQEAAAADEAATQLLHAIHSAGQELQVAERNLLAIQNQDLKKVSDASLEILSNSIGTLFNADPQRMTQMHVVNVLLEQILRPLYPKKLAEAKQRVAIAKKNLAELNESK
jgi:hypothetical protein